MALIPLIDCYDLLDMDPNTFRRALKQAGIVPLPIRRMRASSA
jgi:hypothetical protein